MYKRIFIFLLMMLYIYTASFDIFLNKYFRLPSPLILALPLIFLFGNVKHTAFLYKREFIIFFICFFFYYLIGESDMKTFFVYLIIFACMALYFNFFVGHNYKRYVNSIFLFYLMLTISTIVMLLNHVYPSQIDVLRYQLRGAYIEQSPSGIAVKIFTFGYQLAALSTFIFVFACTRGKGVIIKIGALITVLLFIYWGMQRSVLVVFIASVSLFLIFYYNWKTVMIIAALSVIIGGTIYSSIEEKGYEKKDQNIFAKNEKNEAKGEERGDLITENLKIYTDYPFGLIFYGKDWYDVTRTNRVYEGGLTSHNAYLMFITYLGPFLGIALLISVYKKIFFIFIKAIKTIRDKDKFLIVGLCFSFLAVSANSFFHNDWLIGVNGPTIFLYFAILHYSVFKPKENEIVV